MQHADRIALNSLGDQRPARDNQGELAGPGGAVIRGVFTARSGLALRHWEYQEPYAKLGDQLRDHVADLRGRHS